jgi:hypothetical protein
VTSKAVVYFGKLADQSLLKGVRDPERFLAQAGRFIAIFPRISHVPF